MPKVAAFTVDFISRQADAKLHRTAQTYKDGLSQPDAVRVTDGGFSVELQGDMPRALERGYSAFDMKAIMLASPSAKTSAKGGRYVDVPFRHSMEKSPTRLAGVPTAVRAEVQRAVRSEKSAAASGQRSVRDPLRVTGTHPGTTRTQKRFGSKIDAKLSVEVKTKVGLHADMIRTGAGKGAMFSTIRRISDKSKSSSWWHPGFAGVRAFTAAREVVKKMFVLVIKGELRAGRGTK